MPVRSVQLTEQADQFITQGVSSGRFGDANEAVCEALRLLEERGPEGVAKAEWLRAAAKEGFDAIGRGDYVTLKTSTELSAFMDLIYDEAVGAAAERKSA